MSRVYLSFLGTNDYLPCVYYFGKPPPQTDRKPVRFVQQATIELSCRGWGKSDRINIFTTPDAYRKNWCNDGHKQRGTGLAKRCQGLDSCLGGMNLSATHSNLVIPEGRDEDEIWDIFKAVYDSINEGDEVVFDITHAFRSIPMLAVVVLNYAKTLKRVHLEGIYYGAFEAIGSIEEARKIPESNRLAPILDLTAFNQLLDWTTGIDRFIETGDASLVRRLADETVKSILKASKGGNLTAVSIRNLGKRLEKFSAEMATCRGLSIGSTVSDLKHEIKAIESAELLPPFLPLFSRIKRSMDKFTGDVVSDGIQAAQWCREHNLVQQGYTILNEVVISYILFRAGEDHLRIENREVAGQSITICMRGLVDKKSEWAGECRENEALVRKIIDILDGEPKIIKLIDQVRRYRNDLNHAGFRDNPMEGAKFKKRLKDLLAMFSMYLKY